MKIHGGVLRGPLLGLLQITFLILNTVYFFLKIDMLLLYIGLPTLRLQRRQYKINTVRFLMFILSLTL